MPLLASKNFRWKINEKSKNTLNARQITIVNIEILKIWCDMKMISFQRNNKSNYYSRGHFYEKPGAKFKIIVSEISKIFICHIYDWNWKS